ncbi:hypothetical protein VTO42DRAFT_6589 [Malbranchea cinnamomea]
MQRSEDETILELVREQQDFREWQQPLRRKVATLVCRSGCSAAPRQSSHAPSLRARPEIQIINHANAQSKVVVSWRSEIADDFMHGCSTETRRFRLPAQRTKKKKKKKPTAISREVQPLSSCLKNYH